MSWSPFDPSRMTDEAYLPGDYRSATPPAVASQLLGLLNPALAPIGQMLGLDKAFITQLLGNNVFTTAGDWARGINTSNIMFNRMDHAFGSAFEAATKNASMKWQDAFLGGLGFTAKAIADERDKTFSPFAIAAQLAAREMGLYDMGLRMRIGRMSVGGYSRTTEDPLLREVVGGDLAEARQSAYIGSALAARDRLLARYDEAANSVMLGFAEGGPQKWGGLKGGEVSRLYTYMAKDSAAFQGMTPSDVRQSVQAMSRTMGTLKELFNKDVPALLKDMEQTFGHNAALTYGAATLEKMVTQMKHTSRLSGVSPEAMMQMAQVAEGYSATMGVNRAGGGLTAATMAAQLMGAPAVGASGEYVNQAQLRNLILKKSVGAQQSGLSMAISGAYAAWVRGGAGRTEEEFNEMLNKMGPNISVDSLAATFGLSRQQILSAGRTDAARKFRDTSTAAGAAAMETGMARLKDQRNAAIRSTLKSSGVSDADLNKLDFSGSSDDIIKRIRARFGDMAADNVENIANKIAQLGGYENRQTMDMMDAKQKQARILRVEAANRQIVEAKMKAANVSGLPAMLQAISEGEDDVRKLAMAGWGMTDKSAVLETLVKAAPSLKSVLEKEQREIVEDSASGKIDLERKDRLKKVQTFMQEVMSENYVDEMGEKVELEEKKEIIDALKKGDFKKVDEIRKSHTRAGKRELVRKDMESMGLKDVKDPSQMSAAVKLTALKAAGVDEATIRKAIGAGASGDIDLSAKGMTEKVDQLYGHLTEKTGEQTDRIIKQYEMRSRAMEESAGGGGGPVTLEGVLAQLVEALKALMPMLKGEKIQVSNTQNQTSG